VVSGAINSAATALLVYDNVEQLTGDAAPVA
jgi:hypothetical protein